MNRAPPSYIAPLKVLRTKARRASTLLATLFCAFLSCLPTPAQAQVTIGSSCTTSGAMAVSSPPSVIATCNGSTWVLDAEFSTSGQMAVGQATPAAALDVNGGVKHGNDTASCTSTNYGEIIWTGTVFEGCTGNGWTTFINSNQTVVPTAANTGLSTWVNQGNATETDGATGMQLYATGTWGSSGQPMAALCKTAPSTPYSIIAEVGLLSTDNQWGGMAWRNTTNGKVETIDLWYQNSGGSGSAGGYPAWTIVGFEGYALANTGAYNDTLWNPFPVAPVIWMKLKNDGTNMYEYFSLDGVSWLGIEEETLASSYLGSTGYNQICLELVSGTGSSQVITLMNYQQTSP
jgi:hypothetical protein